MKADVKVPSIKIDPSNPFAWADLFAAMTWPHDERRRFEFVASWSAWAIGKIDEGHVEDRNDTLRKYIFITMLAPSGGLATAAEANGRSDKAELIAALSGPGKVAGSVLALAAQMHLHHSKNWVSINRAWHVHDSQRVQSGTPSPATLSGFKENVWLDWKCVAPLHAALQIARMCWAESARQSGVAPDKWNQSELLDILSWAEWLRDWATSFRPARSHSTLIPVADAVLIDCGVEPQAPPLAPLTANRLHAAKTYAA